MKDGRGIRVEAKSLRLLVEGVWCESERIFFDVRASTKVLGWLKRLPAL